MTDNIKLPKMPEQYYLAGGEVKTFDSDQMEAYAREAVRLNAAPAKGDLVITKNDAGHIVAVTRQDEDGVVLETLAISAPIYTAAPDPQGVPSLIESVKRTVTESGTVIEQLTLTPEGKGLLTADVGSIPGAQGVPEPAEPTNKEKLLANALEKCILASGIVRQDIDGLSGPQLLMFAEDLCQMLAAHPQQSARGVPEPADDATPGPWFVRKLERDGELKDCFVAAPDRNGFAFDAEILGDDEYRDSIQRKLADCELIVAAVNAHRATHPQQSGEQPKGRNCPGCKFSDSWGIASVQCKAQCAPTADGKGANFQPLNGPSQQSGAAQPEQERKPLTQADYCRYGVCSSDGPHALGCVEYGNRGITRNEPHGTE